MNLNNNRDYWIIQELLDEDRLDAYYYSKEFIDFDKYILRSGIKTLKVNKMYKVLDGDHGSVQYVSNGVAFLRAQNIMDGYIDDTNLAYISERQHKELKRSMIYKGDLLLSIMASTGTSAVFSKDISCNANRAVGILRNNNEGFIDNHYAVALINSNIGNIIFERGIRGSIQKRLNLSDINDLNIPIPSPEIQKYIGDKVRKAEELREESNNLNLLCENEIKKVLNLSEGEGLYNNNAGNKSLEYNDYPIKSYVNPRNITNRLDPQSYHPELYETLEKIENLNCRSMKLNGLLENYSTGKSSPKYADNGLQILMTKNIKNNTINWDCKKVEENYINQSDMVNKEELLITTYGGPSIGKVDILFEEKLCTFDYTILKMKFNESCNPYFMTMLLRSKFVQNQIRYLIKGTTGITFIIPNEILDIVIPIINKETQDKIGEVYKKSLDNIKTSKILIQEAKQDIENLIEGNFDTSKIKEINQD